MVCRSITSTNANDFGSLLNSSYPVDQYALQYNVNGRMFDMQRYSAGARLNQEGDLSQACTNLTTTIQDLSSVLNNLSLYGSNTMYRHPKDNTKLVCDVISTDCNNVAVFNGSYDNTIGLPNLNSIEVMSTVNTSYSMVIITTWGQQITWPSTLSLTGSWSNSTNGSSKTIWYFPNADTVDINANTKGYLFAPKAKVTLTGNTQGSVACDSLPAKTPVQLPYLQLPDCS